METPRAFSHPAAGWILSAVLHVAALVVALSCRIPTPTVDDESLIISFTLPPLPPATLLAVDHGQVSAPFPFADHVPLDIIIDEPSAEAADDPPAVEGRPDITGDRELGGEFLTLCLGAGSGAAGKSGAVRAGGRKRRGGCGGGGAHLHCVYGYACNASQTIFNVVVLPLGAGISFKNVYCGEDLFTLYPNYTARMRITKNDTVCDFPPAKELCTFLTWTDLELAAKHTLEYPHLRVVLPVRIDDMCGSGVGYCCNDVPHLAILKQGPKLGAASSIEITATRMPARLVRHIVSLLANQEINNPDAAEEPWACPRTTAKLAVWIERLSPTATTQRGALIQGQGSAALHFP